MTVNQTTLNVSDFIIDLNDIISNDIMICIASSGIVTTIFGKLEKIDTYTSMANIELDNVTSLIIEYDKVESIKQNESLTRNNTLQTELVMNNDLVISIEYQVK